MNPFGDGSNGALNVTSGTTNLLLDTKYQFTNVNIAAGATLSTSSTTGAVMFIVATGTVTIDGTIDLSGKVNPGNNIWSTTVVDGIAINTPGVANGGNGKVYSGSTAGVQSNGFGGGGGGSSITVTSLGLYKGGNGGNGAASNPGGGGVVSITANTNQEKAIAGSDATFIRGGGGYAYALFKRISGNVTGNTFSGNSGRGGLTYGENGTDGGVGNDTVTGGSGSWEYNWQTGGGGGAGGIAGRAGVHLIIRAPNIIINGTINTSGTSGGNGGNGGRNRYWGGFLNFWGQPGGGGGGGHAGGVVLFYATGLTNVGTIIQNGGTGGTGGVGGINNTNTGFSGTNGNSGSVLPIQISPHADFVASTVSGQRPLTVNFTNESLGADSYSWDFGDSGTSTSINPSHQYTTTGTFTVELDATNEAGTDTETKTAYITVTIATYSREAKGTLTFSGGATRKLIAKREAKGTLTFSGIVFGLRRVDPTIIDLKTFMYKVYDEDNNFVGVWDDVIDEPNWSQELNTTGSALSVILARNSDSLVIGTEALLDSDDAAIKDDENFDILTTTTSRNKVGPGSDVNHNYRVDIWIFYGIITTIDDSDGLPIQDHEGNNIQGTQGSPNGVRKFTGFISEINSRYGGTETTEVQLMSYGYDLDQYPVISGGDTTVAFNSVDPSDIVRDGLDQFAIDAGGNSFTTYTSATVEDTNTVASYTFRVNTYKELLDTSVKLAPTGWFYYVGLGDNLVRFKPKPVTARHTFYLGKHIKELNLRSYIGDSINDVIFSGGGEPALYKRYTETPVAGTRRGLSRLSDGRVELESSADLLSEGEIDEKKNIQYRSTIEILDKTYDIESIELGDMVAFRNFDNYVDALTMQIVALNYTPDVITLQLDTLPPTVSKRLEELRKSLNTQETLYVPDTPSV